MSDIGPLIYSNQISESFTHALSSGEQGLKHAPLLLLRIIEEGHWRKRYVERLKQVVEFDRFIDYVTADPLPGIGASVEILRRLCADNIQARQALEDALIGERGAPEGNKNADKTNRVIHPICSDLPSQAKQTKSLRRLRREFPALHAQVMAGKKTITAAAVEAGIYPKRVSVNLQDAKSAAQSIVRNAGAEYAADLVRQIEEVINGRTL